MAGFSQGSSSPRRVLLLLFKDLRRHRRSPLGVLVMLAFPLVFSGMLALAFGGGGDDDGLPTIRLLYEDRDDGIVGGFVESFLGNEEVADLVELVPVGEEGAAMMEAGEASALLRVPEGASDALLSGESIAFELIRNPAQGILPEIAEQMAAILADAMNILTRVIEQQLDSAGLSLGDLESLDQLDFESLGDEDLLAIARTIRSTGEVAYRYLNEPPMELTVVDLGEPEEAGDEEDSEDDSGPSQRAMVFLFILPGISVYSLFLIGDHMMRDLLTEDRLGTLRRQLTAPLGVGEVLASKLLLSLVVASGALLILATIAGVISEQSVDPLGFVALALSLVLSVAGAAATIYGSVSTERQGATLSSLIYLVLAFGSGSFIPLDNLPSVMSRVATFSPFYWGTEGFKKLLQGASLGEIQGMVLAMAVLGVGLLATGSVLLHRRILRGGVG